MSQQQGLDLNRITAEATAYVASLSDEQVLRELTNIEAREQKKKLKLQEQKEKKKATEAAIVERGKKLKGEKK